MIYQQFNPHPALSPYIDAFWTNTATSKQVETIKILPDGCVDLIINLGEDSPQLLHGKTYLVGTMSTYSLVEIAPGTKLLGIRFKPGAFNAFYKFDAMDEVTDTSIVFDTPDLKNLNKFYLDKLSQPKHHLLPIIADIEALKGRVSVDALAKRHFNTVRKLERSFNQHIGLTPKAFINFVRYNAVLKALKNKTTTLENIAHDFGFYDQAHLTNEVKRYTGVTPSQL